MKSISDNRQLLIQSGLKITPQRLAVLEAIIRLNNHPTADNIIDHIKINHPNIAVGTVYKTLETMVEKGIILKVTTQNNTMRYDAITQKHHHLYFSDSDKIEDYYNEELNKLIEQYFEKEKIPGFAIEEVKLQIIGKRSNK
jgi:Fur family peroxide stress response transcriptional regulator